MEDLLHALVLGKSSFCLSSQDRIQQASSQNENFPWSSLVMGIIKLTYQEMDLHQVMSA